MISPQLCHVGGKVDSAKNKPRVGLTGGIASGKTLVAAGLELCGAAVAFADQMARGLMEQPGPVRSRLVELLGARAYLEDGSLDRPALGARLFADAGLLARVNGIVHPAVREATEAWQAAAGARAPYTVYESALLWESGAAADFDVVVHVYAPRAVRLQRATARDASHRAAVEARMDAQWTDEQRLTQDAYVLLNDGTSLLLPQIHALHTALLDAGEHAT